MNSKEIKKKLLEISDLANTDNEGAHCSEDSLFSDFVKAIIDDKYKSIEEIKECAKLVIKVEDIDYDRWYS